MLQSVSPKQDLPLKPDPAEPRSGVLAPFSIAAFRIIWICNLFANLGTWAQSVAAAWVITTEQSSPLMVAMIQVAAAFPLVALSIVTGVLADNYDRRKVMLAGMLLELAGGVFITTAGADEITGKDCNRATFRWSVPTFGAIEQTVRPLLEKLPKAKRWYTITPQYVFGDGLLNAAKAIFKEKGIEHVGNSYHSLTEKEFSGYLTNALAAKPDVLLILNFGSQSSDTLRQAVSFGMKQNCTILVAWASGLEQFESLGADLCEGVYFGAQYWHGIDSPLNKELVKLSREKTRANPNYSLAGSYICTRIMLDAIVKAGSADPAKVVAVMEGMAYEGLTGPEEIRKADHQVMKNYYLLKGRAKKDMKDKDDYAEIVHSGRSFLPPAETGCKL